MRVASQSIISVCWRRFLVLVAAVLAIALAPPIRIADAQVDSAYLSRSLDDLQHLVAPIALYPDALLAEVLAATTYPDDVVSAAGWENAGNNLQAIDAQPWDSSVKGVARYSGVLQYLAGNSDWMNDLGDAFLNQRADVMTAVQNLRGQALAAGTLASTPQQSVINQDGYIQIIPTNPDLLYPPIYDPQVVYAPPPYVGGSGYASYVTFGPGVDVGAWLDFDLDWYDHGIYHGGWGRDRPWWHEHDRYLQDRPGIYSPGRFNDRDGHPINAPSDHWQRDEHKPAPRVVNRPAQRPLDDHPERGYPPRATPQPNQPAPPAPTPRGSEVARQSERGKNSRQTPAQPPPQAPAPERQPVVAQPRPAPSPSEHATAHSTPAPAPSVPAPSHSTPAHSEPAPARSAPTPAPSAPVPTHSTPAPAHPGPARSEPPPSSPPPEARPSAPVRGGAMGGYQNGASASHSADRGAASRGKH